MEIPNEYMGYTFVKAYDNYALYEKQVNGYTFRQCFLYCELCPRDNSLNKYVGNRTAYHIQRKIDKKWRKKYGVV